MLYGYVSNVDDTPRYDDILQSDMSSEEKVKAIKQRGDLYNAELDKQLQDYKNKAYLGAALQIGSAAIPAMGLGRAGAFLAKGLVPQVGKAIANEIVTGATTGGVSGAVEGLGRGLIENENPFKTAATDAFSGIGLGGLGGYAGGLIGRNIAKKGLLGNAEAQQKFFDDYIEGLSNDAVVRNGYLDDFRALKSGNYGVGSSDVLPDIVDDNFRNAQVELIQKVNPPKDDYHTWIRKRYDIADPEIVFSESDFAGTPDWTLEQAQKALNDREIKVYSSKPIVDGSFVSPSRIEGKSYAGGKNGEVYEATVPLEDVALIDSIEGQYAPRHSLLNYLKNEAKKDIIEIGNVEDLPNVELSPQEYAIFMHNMDTYANKKPNNSLFNKAVDPNSYTVHKKNGNYIPKNKERLE